MNIVMLAAAVAGLSVDVTTESPFHIIDWGSGEEAVVTIANTGKTETVEWSGDVRVEDCYGRHFVLAESVKLAPGERKRVHIPSAGVTAKGVWKVKTDFGETQFGVLDARAATPKVPFGRFRLGINVHYERLPREEWTKATEAATRMGAKIVRALGVFGGPYKASDKPGWADTFPWMDRMLGEFEREGLAVNALFSMVWHQGDIIGPYLTAFAKRYGERIDYYEIGNEWDLIKAGEATPMMAAGMQMMCCGALRRGNPKVRVATNGFAVEDSEGHFNVTQKGFQEEFLPLARGSYDIHTMHLHFPYYDFERRLGRFFAMRKATGTTEPYFLNECALPATYRSEQEVADNVWQKFCLSWARGATDQVWYELLAPRMGAKGGYAVMTRDYRPRLAYAAFSAFAKLTEGCECTGLIVEKEKRRVFRFEGGSRSGSRSGSGSCSGSGRCSGSGSGSGSGSEERGERRVVYVGWDPAIEGFEEIGFGAKGTTYDVMGNVVGEGKAWRLGASPTAIVFEGGAEPEPDLVALEAAKKAPPKVMDVKPERHECGWDLHMAKFEYVHENYPADPFTAHRQWKGRDDLSADVLFERKDMVSPALMRVTVHDEKDAAGDAVHVYRDGREITGELKVKRVRHGDNRTVYEAEWPDLKNCRFNIRIDDDDGFGGLDGYIEYAKGSDGDTELWPILKFD